MANFMERATAGEIPFNKLEDEIELAIEDWCKNHGDDEPLHKFLGMTTREYALWVQRPPAPSLTLDIIVNGRKSKLKKE